MTRTDAVEVAVPRSVAELQLFDRVDYEDAYAVDAGLDRPAGDWMSAFIQEAPLWFALPWVTVGTALLGARFGPLRVAPGYVLGWKVLVDRPDLFVCGLDSRGGLSARLIARTTPGRAVMATQIQLTTTYARSLWPGIRRGHRYFAPYLLTRAQRKLSSEIGPGTAAGSARR